jgi:hypothetical protein
VVGDVAELVAGDAFDEWDDLQEGGVELSDLQVQCQHDAFGVLVDQLKGSLTSGG